MSTQGGANFTPRTSRRIQARQEEAERSRFPTRARSVPPIPRITRSKTRNRTATVMEPERREGTERARDRTRTAIPAERGIEVTPSQPAEAVSEPLEARQERVSRDKVPTVRDIQLTGTSTANTGEIRELRTRTLTCEDQLQKVIAEVQTLRRDVNSLLENARSQSQDRDLARLQLADHPTANQPNPSSFSKLSELVARLEQLDHPKRPTRRSDEEDHTRETRKHRRSRRKNSDTHSSSDDDRRQRRSEPSGSSSEGDDQRRHRHKTRQSPKRGGTFRPKGRKCKHLKPLNASDSKFREVLDYRYYRLDRTSTSRDLRKLRYAVKSMMVTLRRHIFDGHDPILILDFLRRFSNECDAQGLTEPQALCALEYFLEGTAADHFASVNNASTADEGGVSSWPEAVHYLLRSYATHDAIREASQRLTSIRQNPDEPEEDYSARLNNASIRCGNVHAMEGKKTIFIDGLTKATKALVSRFREDNPRTTYLELVQFASVEGKTHRARTGSTPHRRAEPPKVGTPRHTGNPLVKRSKPALFADHTNSSNSIFEPRARHMGHDNLHLFGESPAHIADRFPSLPSDLTPSETTNAETYEQDSDPTLYLTPRSRTPTSGNLTVKPQRLNFDTDVARTRPGWQTPRRQAPPVHGAEARIICHICYVRNDHIAPDCNLPLKDQWKVLRNYAALSTAEKERVPPTSYAKARVKFAEDGSAMPDLATRGNNGPRTDLRVADDKHPAILQRSKSPTSSVN